MGLAGRQAQEVKTLASKPEDLCLVPRTHIKVERRNGTNSTELPSDLHTYTTVHTSAHTQRGT